MNIIEKLNQKFNIFEFKYYGTNDYATGFDINLLLQNSNVIRDYFNKEKLLLSSVDDFIDFLFVKKYCQFAELEQLINEDVRGEFINLLNNFNKLFNSVDNGNLIKLMNKEYRNILKLGNHSILQELFTLSFKYYNGCLEIIKFFIDNYFYMILDNLESIQKIILEIDDLSSMVLDEKHFTSTQFRLDEYFGLIKLFHKKEKFKEKTNKLIGCVINYGKETNDLINEDNVIQYEYIIKKITKFLKEIENISANKFEEYCNTLSNTMEKYLEKHGHSFSYKIPVEEFKKYFENKEIPWINKIISLTHNKKEDKYITYHEEVMKQKTNSLTDMLFSSTTPHDDYFTMTKQQSLNLYDQTYLHSLQFFVNKTNIQEFISQLATLIMKVCKQYKIDFNENEFDKDLNILLNLFIILFDVSNNDEDNYQLIGLNYSLSSFIVCLIEKFLRIFYKSQNTEKYINISYYNLGNFLSEKNDIMVSFLGLDNIKVYRYYLLVGGENEVGYNYRNNFAHYRNIKVKDIHYGVVLKIMQIFLMIVTQLYLKSL